MRWWAPTSSPRGEVRLFTYAEADRLLREVPPQWKLAPEEDTNRVVGVVYLERMT